jgi:hypothetical protein
MSNPCQWCGIPHEGDDVFCKQEDINENNRKETAASKSAYKAMVESPPSSWFDTINNANKSAYKEIAKSLASLSPPDCQWCGLSHDPGNSSCDKAKKIRDGADPVEHPRHYTSDPSGVECIDVVEHLNFCRGNAVKYIWRAGLKGNEIEDLQKARWYLTREIARLEKRKK